MTREEAIRRIKAWNLDSDDREVLAVIIPELAESEDERIRKALYEFISDTLGDEFDGYDFNKREALAYLEKQKPAEWSEEDEKMLARIIERGQSQIQMFETGLLPEHITWLKSLRPQLKQEWSEEDKRKLNRIYEILGQAADERPFGSSKRIIGDKEAVELQDFLKSLRPQWKPSEEQMKALQNAVALTACDKELARLYNQLKKL